MRNHDKYPVEDLKNTVAITREENATKPFTTMYRKNRVASFMQDELNIRWRKTYERKSHKFNSAWKGNYQEVETEDDEDADAKEDVNSSSIW